MLAKCSGKFFFTLLIDPLLKLLIAFRWICTPGALVLFKWATSKLNVASWIFAYELYRTLGVKKCQDSKKNLELNMGGTPI